MDPLLARAKALEEELIGYLKMLVECESPSGDAAGINRLVDVVAATPGFERVKRIPGGRFGNLLLVDFSLPGPQRKQAGRILGLGHLDTVWPVGTLAKMPFRRADGRLWGPGVLDMKGGVAFFIFAMRILREMDIPVRRRVCLLLVPDEEVGSEASRPITEREARESSAVLVLEPGTGLAGKLKTARKGVGNYNVKVQGRASHAGVDFGSGASAILELCRQVERIAGFTDIARGLTVNPGVIRGGTRTNVVAAEAEVEVDIRVTRIRDAGPLDRKFRSLKPVDRRCTISVEGGLNRPPMERTAGVIRLFRLAKKLGAELGVAIEESSTGGGSDGNFTAGLGIPTLDGIGTVGEGAHAANESILIDRIADRTALLAKLVQSLGAE
jgi:glutamate carboxypeptidase